MKVATDQPQSPIPDRLLTQAQVSEIICMSEAWLEQSRFKGTGLPYVKIGRSIRYRSSDINSFVTANVVGSGI